MFTIYLFYPLRLQTNMVLLLTFNIQHFVLCACEHVCVYAFGCFDVLYYHKGYAKIMLWQIPRTQNKSI
jgi:hypothetical protein